MGKSSINIQPIKEGSEMHNNRDKALDYVRADLTKENESFLKKSVSETEKKIAELYEKKVGQKMQAKATPIREAVLLLDEKHKIQDLQNLAQKIEERFKIQAIQGYIHRDEGHYNEAREWKPNLHAHLVFDWQDKETGKTIKLNRQNMSELQTLVATTLGLERGTSSDKKHLNALQFKNQEEETRLSKIIEKAKTIEISHRQVEEYSVKGLLGEDKSKTIEGLKTALKNEITKREDFAKEKEKNRLKIEEKEKEIKGWKFEQDFILKRAFDYLKDKTPEKESSLKKAIMLHTENKEIKNELDKELKEERLRELPKSLSKTQKKDRNLDQSPSM
jgi:hypothetical protein